MISLGRFHYPDPVVVLAPMAGISDLPFRRLCQKLGSHYTIAEMICARPELLNTRDSQLRLQFDDDPAYPKIVQLVGGNGQIMAETAQLMQENGADVIDINMGCPAKKVGQQNAGSALLAFPDQVKTILTAVVNAVSIPVTLKTRIGFNDQQVNIAQIGLLAEEAGVAAITVHGRTRAQRFRGQARYQEIGDLKSRLSIPVIVNGDISQPEQAKALINAYGFDGVMIGRAVQGNPWLLGQIREALSPDFQVAENCPAEIIKNHILALHSLYGHHGERIARKHLHWYFATHPDYPSLRETINQGTNKDQLALIDQCIHRLPETLCG